MLITIYHSYFRFPEEGGGIRSFHLAQKLLKEGHEVKVISRHNDLRGDHVIDGVHIRYYGIPYDNNFGFLRRVFGFLLFQLKAIRYSLKYRSDLNYIISTPLTNGLVGVVAKKLRKTPFIFEVGDLWPDVPIELGIIKTPLLKRILIALEKKIYKESILITALSPAIKGIIEEKTIGTKRVVSIPNFSDCEFFKPSEPPTTFDNSTPFIISYIGTLGFANDLGPWLDLAEALEEAALPVQFKIMGNGAQKELLQSKSRSLALSNVAFLPFSDKPGVRTLLNSSHAVIVSFAKGNILHTGSPNKLFDGLAAGKLIIHNLGGWIEEIVKASACGIRHDILNPNVTIQCISDYLSNPNLLLLAQSNARRLGETEFEKEKLLQVWYESIID